MQRQAAEKSRRRFKRFTLSDGDVLRDVELTNTEVRTLRGIAVNVRRGERFILESRHGSRDVVYYNVEDDVFRRQAEGATLFMRRDIAEAVALMINPNVKAVRCKTRPSRPKRGR